MGKLKEILKIFGIYSAGHVAGYFIGKKIHEIIAYEIPLSQLEKTGWFSFEKYLRLYGNYSQGIENFLTLLFGILTGGLALGIYYEDEFYKSRKVLLLYVGSECRCRK
jgi:hypothetical protein